MFESIKTIFLISIFSILFIATSCLDSGIEEPPRTAETEIAELEIAISSLESQGYDVDTTELGVFYIIVEDGEGPTVQTGDTCYMEYAGYLLDGTMFDASMQHYENAIWEFVYKEVDLIEGFEDGISLMSKGTEIDMIIPSSLAYGSVGAGFIQPYSPLRFAAKLHDLKPN